MRIGMIADAVTSGGDGANDLRVLLSPLADGDERGTHSKLCQHVEDTWCEAGVGAVVKGQGHDGLSRRTTLLYRLNASAQEIGTNSIECHACAYRAEQDLADSVDGIHPAPPPFLIVPAPGRTPEWPR